MWMRLPRRALKGRGPSLSPRPPADARPRGREPYWGPRLKPPPGRAEAIRQKETALATENPTAGLVRERNKRLPCLNQYSCGCSSEPVS